MTARFLLLHLLLPVAVIAPRPALAAPVAPDSDAQGSMRVVQPLSLYKEEDLEFGTLTATAAGTAVIDPNLNTLRTTGGVIAVGGNPHAALFLGAASKQTVVIIRIPKNPVILRRAGGTETMTLSNWTLQGQDKRALAAQSSFTFRVGGTLNVGANQAEGVYTGTFTVEVQYP